ncbi:MAG: hypothetical protein IJP43_08060 [Oscillospiraceae bacterium]|nr:hypothetical protein [Oscillospiraceae bacterium]
MESADKLRKTLYFAVVWALVAIIAISGGTYAWFSFYASTNVTPIHGRIGGSKSLLISNNPNGVFAESCELILSDEVTLLEPVSTADMSSFFAASAQSETGITDLFYRVENPYERLMHGFVYLRCDEEACDVYFSPEGFEVGGTPAVWASGRLGMRITTSNGTITRVFALDELGDTSGAASLHTINGDGVISGVDNGYAVLSADPSEAITPYFAGGDRDDPTAGQSRLFYIGAGETVTVEYFVWLEGCDDNCLEGVKAGDMSLELSFAGV